MGWAHAVLTILVGVGASHAISWLLSLLDYGFGMKWLWLHDILGLILIIWAPAPIVIGITIWKKKVFGEQPRADGRMTLPAITTIIILGMWWALLISNPIRDLAGV